MNIYFINRNSSWKGPFDVKDAKNNKILTLGDICIHDTKDGLVLLYVDCNVNTWNSCKIIGRGINDEFTQTGNTLLFSHNGISRRRGNIGLLKTLKSSFHHKYIDSFFTNAIEILEYKRDFWDFGIFQQLYKLISGSNCHVTCCQGIDKKQENYQRYPSLFASYFDETIVKEIFQSLDKGKTLRDAYNEIRNANPILFRNKFQSFFHDHPKKNIYAPFNISEESGKIHEKNDDTDLPDYIDWCLTPLSYIGNNLHVISGKSSPFIVNKLNDDICPCDLDMFRWYIDIIKTYPSYSDEALNYFFSQYNKGDKKSYDLIVKSSLAYVVSIAQSFCDDNTLLMDLIQEGNIGLIKAIERFDHLKSLSFSEYAKSWILQSISNSMTYLPYMIKLPLNQLNLYRNISRFKKRFEQENEYPPSVNDIEVADDSFDRIAFLYRLPDNLKDLVSLSKDLDSFVSERNLVDVYDDRDYNKNIIITLLNQLNSREKFILQSYYGIDMPEQSLNTIGEQIGLTRERVRQIREKAIDKLRIICGQKKNEVRIGDIVRNEISMQIGEVVNVIKGNDDSTIMALKMRNGDIEEVSAYDSSYKIIRRYVNKKSPKVPSYSITKEKKSLIQYNPQILPDVKEIQKYNGFNVGDTIVYKNSKCLICKILEREGLFRILVKYENGILDYISNNEVKSIRRPPKNKIETPNKINSSQEKEKTKAPVRIDDIENKDEARNKDVSIKRLSMSKGTNCSIIKGKRNQSFSYKSYYKYYTSCIDKIRQAKINGETIIAKPVLILALIDGIEANVFKDNCFIVNDWLEEKYKLLMKKYLGGSQFDKITSIEKPFWHMESDGFWHIRCLGEQKSKGHTPSKMWMKMNVDFAYFDEELWKLLQDAEWRRLLYSYVIESKLTYNA